MVQRVFDYAVSLGPSCRTKWQLIRKYSRKRIPSGVFDWRLTPLEAVEALFASDFRGLYRIGDLHLVDGQPTNTRLGITMPHDFGNKHTMLSMALHLPTALSKHTHRIHNMRRLFNSDARLLIVTHSADADALERIDAAIRRYNPSAKFWLETVNDPDRGPPDWPANRQWWGDAAEWDRVLSAYSPG